MQVLFSAFSWQTQKAYWKFSRKSTIYKVVYCASLKRLFADTKYITNLYILSVDFFMEEKRGCQCFSRSFLMCTSNRSHACSISHELQGWNSLKITSYVMVLKPKIYYAAQSWSFQCQYQNSVETIIL